LYQRKSQLLRLSGQAMIASVFWKALRMNTCDDSELASSYFYVATLAFNFTRQQSPN